MPQAVPTPAERQAFLSRPLTKATREVARDSDRPTAVRFFKEIAEQAESEADHVLVADLARELGRRDLGVILGQAAHVDGHGVFRQTSFPLIPIPQGANWTFVHAISRQESQFAMNAVSHAGARGLMQLMPGTAREQAGKMGYDYNPGALTTDAGYNMLLGDGYFRRMLDYYGGSYPLAVAAYNAGPGNVNKWLRANGDPRSGAMDWVEWVEKIPVTETRNYVQRVLENAVVYEAMYPARAINKGPNPLSFFLGKRYPGKRTALPQGLDAAAVHRQEVGMKEGPPITPAGMSKLRTRYDHLLGTERPAIVEIVSWAAGNGDRSENGDYLYGRKRMREVDRELAHLARRMKACRVIDPAAQQDRGKAWFGAAVTIADEDDNHLTVTLVGDDEQDASAGRIGWSAPMARALRGAAVGDLRKVRLPGGEKEWEVLNIAYPEGR